MRAHVPGLACVLVESGVGALKLKNDLFCLYLNFDFFYVYFIEIDNLEFFIFLETLEGYDFLRNCRSKQRHQPPREHFHLYNQLQEIKCLIQIK